MVEVEPALDTECFFETIYGLARAGKLDPDGQPHPLQIAVLLAGRHRGEMYLARPPIPVQKAFAAIAAPIGRLLGYRDRYPEFSSWAGGTSSGHVAGLPRDSVGMAGELQARDTPRDLSATGASETVC